MKALHTESLSESEICADLAADWLYTHPIPCRPAMPEK